MNLDLDPFPALPSQAETIPAPETFNHLPSSQYRLLLRLLTWAQRWPGPSSEVGTALSQMVDLLTDGHILLFPLAADAVSVLQHERSRWWTLPFHWDDDGEALLLFRRSPAISPQMSNPYEDPSFGTLLCALCRSLLVLLTRCAAAEEHAAQQAPPTLLPPFDQLRPREVEILRYMLTGASTTQIAHLMQLSQRTVTSYQSHLYQTLDVHSRAEAVALASAHHVEDAL
jgi:DNA-binding CsgD family transcriptional regulator